ncbi:hypothetical protein IB260_21665 [Pseudomonas sp. PDM23]|uniref:hypothetical protein n=1 Tax=unclassified Pseudomonas TaxID=196821 RepID=UPI0017801500|nr:MULTISPECIES: hypothetical protein [unclassified Pseudomonas]MBD9577948.1 hypothetical protein [Pseudomonas sp. PDM23]MBD9672506.1 hypothetical protein [Pseudomonas sp. PDM21]
MKVLADKQERWLFIFAVSAFFLLIVVEIRFKIPHFLEGTDIAKVLVADATQSVVADLLVGLLSAYVFYLLIDYAPRLRKEREAEAVLNIHLASILSAFDKVSVFGHETAVTEVNCDVLRKSWLDANINRVMEGETSFLSLKTAMFVAHSRLEDFRSLLVLASSISSDRALRWMVITEKVKLFAEEYGNQPVVEQAEFIFVDHNAEESPLGHYKASLAVRFLEVMEQAEEWLYGSSRGSQIVMDYKTEKPVESPQMAKAELSAR